jgi:L-ascorbate metabolism protein UlaG (beta-lactamase superfamily)
MRSCSVASAVAFPVVAAVLAVGACAKPGASPSPASSAKALSTPTTARPADTVATAGGELEVIPLHHGTVAFDWKGKTILVDPFHEANYSGLPKADLVLITDIHPDHLDPDALALVATPTTLIVAPPAVVEKLPKTFTRVVTLKNGEATTALDVGVEAVPMYNLTRGPGPGKLFHDKGRGDGFVLTFADKRVYLSGDTECTGEMRALKSIDVAFVCMNLPYTMPPSEAAACVKAFRPKVVYPYHYRGSNLAEFTGPLAGDHDIEVRERSWY